MLASLAVVAPDGWVESKGAALGAPDASEAVLYIAPSDDQAFYLVTRSDGIEPSHLIDREIARAKARGSVVVSRVGEAGGGRSIEDLVLAHADGTRTHIRALRGSRPSTLVGMCHGRDREYAACEAKIKLLVVEVQEIDHGNIGRLLLWIAGGLIGVGFVGYVAIALLQRRRLARSPVLVEGNVVTISGVVQPATKPLEAALSGRGCVMHRSRARVLVKERLISEPREVEIQPFVIVTKRGLVRIDVDTLALEVPPAIVVDHATERQRAFRARHDIPEAASVAFDEIRIEPGAKVTMRGIVTLERDATAINERGYRDDAPTSIRLVGRADKPLTLLKIW